MTENVQTNKQHFLSFFPIISVFSHALSASLVISVSLYNTYLVSFLSTLFPFLHLSYFSSFSLFFLAKRGSKGIRKSFPFSDFHSEDPFSIELFRSDRLYGLMNGGVAGANGTCSKSAVILSETSR